MPNTISQVIDGTTLEFPIFTRRECMAYTGKAFAEGRAKVMKDLQDAGASADARAAALDKFRQLEGTDELLLRYIKTLDGSVEIVSASLAKIGVHELPALGNDDFVILAARLCGFVVKEKADGANPDKDDDDDGFVRPIKPSGATG